MKIRNSLICSTASALAVGMGLTFAPEAKAVSLKSITISPSTVFIPSGGFGSSRAFTIAAEWENPDATPFKVDASYEIIEIDLFFDDTTFAGNSIFTIGANSTFTDTKTTTLTASTLNSFCDLGSCTNFFSRLAEAADSLPTPELEFEATASFTATAVPEPLTILGSGMALGFGALLKRQYSNRQKNGKSLEKHKS